MRVYEYTVNSNSLSYFINGDLSYLDYSSNDNELEKTLAFEQAIIAEYGEGHFTYKDEEAFFARDEITGLMAECITLQYVTMQ